MRTNSIRATQLFFLVAIVLVAGVTLLQSEDSVGGSSGGRSTTRLDARVAPEAMTSPGRGRIRFQPCPWPPCMAPCQLVAVPEGLCKTPYGSVTRTTFTCCCCGGGGSGASFAFF